MNNFLETIRSQFIENECVSNLINEPNLEKYLNVKSAILMYVYKDEETGKIISVEFVGV